MQAARLAPNATDSFAFCQSITYKRASNLSSLCLTSKMSHDGSWRAACSTTIYFLWFHFEAPSVARGVSDPGVGSGALLGRFLIWLIAVERHLLFFFPSTKMGRNSFTNLSPEMPAFANIDTLSFEKLRW